MGMTVERTTTFLPEDIATIELECAQCGARVVYPARPIAALRSVDECPNCREPFTLPSRASLSGLLGSMATVGEQLSAKGNRFRMRFGLKPEA